MSNWKVPPVSANLLSELRTAVDVAEKDKAWVVVVCPDGSEFLAIFQTYAESTLPSGSSFSGRTALLPGGGRISVAASGDEPFPSPGTPFAVLFLGWGDDLAADNRRMQLWRARATRVLR